MQRKCTKSKRLRSTNSNQATNKAANHKMTLAKITKVKGTITGHNHMENVNSLPVSQQYQLQRNSSKVPVNKQRRLTQVLFFHNLSYLFLAVISTCVFRMVGAYLFLQISIYIKPCFYHIVSILLSVFLLPSC